MIFYYTILESNPQHKRLKHWGEFELIFSNHEFDNQKTLTQVTHNNFETTSEIREKIKEIFGNDIISLTESTPLNNRISLSISFPLNFLDLYKLDGKLGLNTFDFIYQQIVEY